MKSRIVFVFVVVCLGAKAQLKPSSIFGDNMVLQRDQPVIVWGKANRSSRVTVEFAGQSAKVKADKTGAWKVELDPVTVGGPYLLSISSEDENFTFKNILVGDVWLCSGQSNMEWTVERSDSAEMVISESSNNQIRHIKIPRNVSFDPLADFEETEWKVADPQNTGSFTAVGYFFAREVQKETGIPIGLVNSTWGGTNAETWTPYWKIMQLSDYKNSLGSLSNKNNLEAKIQQKMDSIRENYSSLPSEDAGTRSGEYVWSNTDFSNWEDTEVPGLWEDNGLPYLDGVVWFARSFTLTQEDIKSDALLSLGKIDDSDISFINGVNVGEMIDLYAESRNYAVDKAILKVGENSLIVRVEDYQGGGGIYGSPNDVFLQTGSRQIELAGKWKRKIGMGEVNVQVNRVNDFPAQLYNAMINPITNLKIKGALWYQGESNSGRSKQYNSIFPALITSWRKEWGTNFPFYFVQLASFYPAAVQPENHGWAELREAQLNTLKLEKTGMAVTTDIGNANDIHPTNKQGVGKRLSYIALNKLYGKSDLVFSGPIYKSHEIKDHQVYLSFDHIGSGLKAMNKYGYLQGFSIAGEDQQFHWAQAKIIGDQVVVFSDKVSHPLAVRYAWHANTDDANLYNYEGLPASPFRTDNWPGVTDKARYQPLVSF